MTRHHSGSDRSAVSRESDRHGAEPWSRESRQRGGRESDQHVAEFGWEDALIVAQAHVIARFTGRSLGAARLPRDAAERGRYLAPSDDGYLLELYGIPVNRYRRATLFELVSELAQGHWVVVCATAQDSPNTGQDRVHLIEAPRRAGVGLMDAVSIFAAGIDTSVPGEARIVVAPGHDGDAVCHTLRAFLILWGGCELSMIATQEAAPRGLPEMAHFDYVAGHLPSVGALAYERFIALADNPEALTALLCGPMAEPDSS